MKTMQTDFSTGAFTLTYPVSLERAEYRGLFIPSAFIPRSYMEQARHAVGGSDVHGEALARSSCLVVGLRHTTPRLIVECQTGQGDTFEAGLVFDSPADRTRFVEAMHAAMYA